MSDKKTLLLVDGSSYLYRAFHAMPDLRAVPGDPASPPTGAIRGMINMLQSLRKDVHADYAACVFDAKGPTFRDEIYPAYKAQRAPMPDDLRAQIEPIHEVVRLMGWKVLDVPGVEADDVIGTLASAAAEQGVEVLISSGDKDLAQLVNSHITIVDTMNGKRRDVAGVEAEFGVPPALMIDFQTLVGDAVDNVPGVEKVGPKTAAKWLQEYGSLDNIVAHADAIKGVAGENLRKALDWLPTGRQLLTIKTDCDLNGWVPGLPALDAVRVGEPDNEALKAFYERYGFMGLARALGGEAAPAPKPAGDPGLFDEPAPMVSSISSVKYDTIFDWSTFDAWMGKLQAAELVAIDTETTSLDEMVAEIVGI
ncbi:MAG: DNA polymerase I, partial [Burkholderiaceae bacterium]|nr:DNA polymerase I [Burkholderiaceae bacterium]